MASVYGWDPLAFLALEEDDFRLANLIVSEQSRLEEERERGRLDYLASKTASLTAQSITKWLGKHLPKMLHLRH
ncbi:hypothetical protein [Microbacterium karelineae]|uniref:hypothetical protein n=1 Tax=Microbacterium karelineae TaxID=2654283 RepID=UPI0012E9D8C4|nr:hypothetical protein [Microbacterium karelineae]